MTYGILLALINECSSWGRNWFICPFAWSSILMRISAFIYHASVFRNRRKLLDNWSISCSVVDYKYVFLELASSVRTPPGGISVWVQTFYMWSVSLCGKRCICIKHFFIFPLITYPLWWNRKLFLTALHDPIAVMFPLESWELNVLTVLDFMLLVWALLPVLGF